MNRFLKPQLRYVVLCLAALPAAAMAQTFEQCVGLKSVTDVEAPGSGTVTISDLTKYGYPAQVCTKGNVNGTSVAFEYTATLATTYNNAKFPSNCAGVEYALNGGPTYSAVLGTGNFALAAAVTGTMDATAVSITENLTLSAGSDSYVINTGLLVFKTFVTLNADESVDIRICTPPGGIPTTVNGSSFSIPASVWQCLAEPTQKQANVRITYVEGC